MLRLVLSCHYCRIMRLWSRNLQKVQTIIVNMNKINSMIVFIFITFIVMEPIFPCATCYGAQDAAATEGLNWAIISLLGTTGSVLTGIIIAILSIMNRARKHGKIINEE